MSARRKSYSIPSPLFDSVPRLRISQMGITNDFADADLTVLTSMVRKIVGSKPPNSRNVKDIQVISKWLIDSEKEIIKDGKCLFDCLPKEVLFDVARGVILQTYDAGELLYLQGETGNCFHIILSGAIEIYDADVNKIDKKVYSRYVEEKYENELNGQTKMADTKPDALSKILGQVVIKSRFLVGLQRGNNFGEVALTNPDPIRTASAIATQYTELLAIHKKLYDKTLAGYSQTGNFKQKKTFVSECDCFKNSTPSAFNNIAYLMERSSYNKGATIIKEGDTITGLSFVYEGDVKLTCKPPTVTYTHPKTFSHAIYNKPIEFAIITKYGIINENGIIGGDIDKISRYTITAQNSVTLLTVRDVYYKRLLKASKDFNLQKQLREIFMDREKVRMERLKMYEEVGSVYNWIPKIKEEIAEEEEMKSSPNYRKGNGMKKLSPIKVFFYIFLFFYFYYRQIQI